jgi:PD-(D/E)XK nuclease superfamily
MKLMTDNQKRSLFEYLGIADQERIHTQTLAWLLSPEDSPLDSEQIKILYSEIFNVESDDIKKISVSTEYKNVDLVIQDNLQIIAVENKLKSRQSKEQLKKYDQTIDLLNINKKVIHKFFLTFSGEKSDDWTNLDYQKIHDVLANTKSENIYIKDYVLLLNKLLSSRQHFLEYTNTIDCMKVIERSGLTTEKRITKIINSDNEHVKFICKNRLERLYVEIYYTKLMTAIYPKCSSWFVGESNGNALIQVHFKELIFKVGKKEFVPGFQVQSNSIKYNVASTDYEKSNKEEFTDNFAAILDKCFDKKFRINKSKTKAYRSYSFIIDEFFEKNFSDVCIFLTNEISKCEKVWQEIFSNNNDGVIDK